MSKRKNTTIKDIAKETGLSIATVSRVINKVEGEYSAETKKIVNEAIKRLNYKPDIVARSLKKQETKTIGMVVPEMDGFYSEIFLGAQDTALKHNYATFLCNTSYNEKLEQLHLNNLLNRRVDGVIITSGLLNDNSLVFKFKNEGIPVVLIENFINNSSIPMVILDNYKYAKMAVQHLIDQGYERICYVSGPPEEMYTLQERYRAYVDTLRENNIELDKSLIYFDKSLRGDWDLSKSYQLIESIMTRKDRPDAVFIISDPVAAIALKVITRLGYRIPEDVGVVGFDDRRISKHLIIPLTSVYQPKYEMGVKGMELLLKIIEGEELKGKNAYMEMELKIRESSSRIK